MVSIHTGYSLHTSKLHARPALKPAVPRFGQDTTQSAPQVTPKTRQPLRTLLLALAVFSGGVYTGKSFQGAPPHKEETQRTIPDFRGISNKSYTLKEQILAPCLMLPSQRPSINWPTSACISSLLEGLKQITSLNPNHFSTIQQQFRQDFPNWAPQQTPDDIRLLQKVLATELKNSPEMVSEKVTALQKPELVTIFTDLQYAYPTNKDSLIKQAESALDNYITKAFPQKAQQ